MSRVHQGPFGRLLNEVDGIARLFNRVSPFIATATAPVGPHLNMWEDEHARP